MFSQILRLFIGCMYSKVTMSYHENVYSKGLTIEIETNLKTLSENKQMGEKSVTVVPKDVETLSFVLNTIFAYGRRIMKLSLPRI